MNPDYTHMTVILDRSGSMEEIRDDIIGGFNRFLGDHKAQPGKATLTVVQFDGQDPYELIHQFRPLHEVAPLDRETYVPRGSTPLLDAVGRGINDIEAAIGKLSEAERPAKVIVGIVTDGQENASTEFTRDQVTKMIKAKTDEDAWEFVFLSADLAAFDEAGELGVAGMKRLLFAKGKVGTAEAWRAFSREAGSFRRVGRHMIGFAEEDRERAAEPDKK